MFAKLAKPLYEILFGKASMAVFVGKNLVGLAFSVSGCQTVEAMACAASPWLAVISADLVWYNMPTLLRLIRQERVLSR
ncbi:MAG: hypothetical protein K2Y32_17140 [Candidatus Obscuribacterales bacterium]|nr:hypothetical protein [Candidatus Obscuribacterales bacterium]